MNKDENHRVKRGSSFKVKEYKSLRTSAYRIPLRRFLNLWPLTPEFQVKILSWCRPFWEGTFCNLLIHPFRAFAENILSALVCAIFRSVWEEIQVPKTFNRNMPFWNSALICNHCTEFSRHSCSRISSPGVGCSLILLLFRHSLNASIWCCAFNTFFLIWWLGRSVPSGLDKVIDFHILGIGRKG